MIQAVPRALQLLRSDVRLGEILLVGLIRGGVSVTNAIVWTMIVQLGGWLANVDLGNRHLAAMVIVIAAVTMIGQLLLAPPNGEAN
jgi:Na+-transporting NADH:ubiquinone oxidoreductase subunit NqrE